MLDALEQFAPATVRNVVPKPVSLMLLVDVLRRLVEEGVSVRDLRAILEALSSAATIEKDPLTLTELVRAQLRRPITFSLTRGAGHLGVYLLDPAIEETLRRSITRTPNGAFLTLAPAASRDVIASLRRALDENPLPRNGAAGRVVLTQPDIRSASCASWSDAELPGSRRRQLRRAAPRGVAQTSSDAPISADSGIAHTERCSAAGRR